MLDRTNEDGSASDLGPEDLVANDSPKSDAAELSLDDQAQLAELTRLEAEVADSLPRYGLYPNTPRVVEQLIDDAINRFIDSFGHMIAAGVGLGEAFRVALQTELHPVLQAHQHFGACDTSARYAIFSEILDRWEIPGRDWEAVFDPMEVVPL